MNFYFLNNVGVVSFFSILNFEFRLFIFQINGGMVSFYICLYNFEFFLFISFFLNNGGVVSFFSSYFYNFHFWILIVGRRVILQLSDIFENQIRNWWRITFLEVNPFCNSMSFGIWSVFISDSFNVHFFFNFNVVISVGLIVGQNFDTLVEIIGDGDGLKSQMYMSAFHFHFSLLSFK